MFDSDRKQSKLDELAKLRRRVAQLEAELDQSPGSRRWQARGYYTAYYATAGAILGMIAAAASLLVNVIGSALVNQHPLYLIQVYLTFPLGERALDLEGGIALAIGCCLYLGTGMVYGVAFHLTLTRLTAGRREASVWLRLGIDTVLAVAVWLVNYYVILSWLQPMLFGGNWIVELIPPQIAALTHLVFGWTMALLYPLGLYVPYRLQTEPN